VSCHGDVVLRESYLRLIFGQIPVNLLRAGRVFVFEPPPGVRANLLATFNRVATSSRVQKPPSERARLYFLLAWLHAVIQERLHYAPLGWSKKYASLRLETLVFV